MTKEQFFAHLRALYRMGNSSDQPEAACYAEWSKPEMAGHAFCGTLDVLMQMLIDCGAISRSELNDFYASL